MKNNFCHLVVINLAILVSSNAQELPPGYILQYSQDFSMKNSIADFNFSNPDSWKISREMNNFYLEISEDSGYIPPAISPKNICLLSKYMFGDFILELDFLMEAKEFSQSDVCIFFGLRDTLKYYYVSLSLKANVDNHKILIVNNASQDTIATETNDRILPVNNKWNKAKIERNIVTKTITVYVNNMSNPLMEVKDKTLIMGYLGFGSFDGPCRLDNIKIYAPTAIPEKSDIFTSY